MAIQLRHDVYLKRSRFGDQTHQPAPLPISVLPPRSQLRSRGRIFNHPFTIRLSTMLGLPGINPGSPGRLAFTTVVRLPFRFLEVAGGTLATPSGQSSVSGFRQANFCLGILNLSFSMPTRADSAEPFNTKPACFGGFWEAFRECSAPFRRSHPTHPPVGPPRPSSRPPSPPLPGWASGRFGVRGVLGAAGGVVSRTPFSADWLTRA